MELLVVIVINGSLMTTTFGLFTLLNKGKGMTQDYRLLVEEMDRVQAKIQYSMINAQLLKLDNNSASFVNQQSNDTFSIVCSNNDLHFSKSSFVFRKSTILATELYLKEISRQSNFNSDIVLIKFGIKLLNEKTKKEIFREWIEIVNGKNVISVLQGGTLL